MRQYLHDPDAILDYVFDWSDWCALHANDTITSAIVTAPPLTTISSVTHTATSVTAWVTTTAPVGSRVEVRCRITTAGGRQDDRTLVLVVEQR